MESNAVLSKVMVEPQHLTKWLKESGALREGHFLLSSGRHSSAYVQCALLLEDPDRAQRLGALLAESLQMYHPQAIVSPALGGLIIGHEVARSLQIPFRFSERHDGEMTLRRGFSMVPGERIVIVEDVVTTGKSAKEVEALLISLGVKIAAVGSILDRTGGDNPFQGPFVSLMTLTLPNYSSSECPACNSGLPIDQPGSRGAS